MFQLLQFTYNETEKTEIVTKKVRLEVTTVILQHMLQITLPYKIKEIHYLLKMTTKYEKLSQFNAAVTLQCLADEEEQ